MKGLNDQVNNYLQGKKTHNTKHHEEAILW